MKYLMIVLTCIFIFACSDKDEDTGSDTAAVVEDTGDSTSE